MISRKALIKKLQNMDLNQVLFAGINRTSNYRGQAAEKALGPLIGLETFNQREHVLANGTMKANPRWLKQLHTDLAWASGDITPGSILVALGAPFAASTRQQVPQKDLKTQVAEAQLLFWNLYTKHENARKAETKEALAAELGEAQKHYHQLLDALRVVQ